MNGLQTLIFMPCHAIYLRGPVHEESAWALLDYQIGNGHLPRLLQHVEAACALARRTPDALLVFSGGQTRPGIHRCEGESQLDVADQLGCLTGISAERVTHEAFAQDSFQNCAFSLARFVEFSGDLPARVIAVGWQFKAQRFAEHMAALLPMLEFSYEGVNDPPDSHLPAALRSEATIREAFRSDPHGLRSPLLDKKRERNWARRRHGYLSSVAPVSHELASILSNQYE